MTKKLLTKHCAMLLLAVFAAAWSTSTQAITINVSASQAPYVYAWDNSQNPLLDAYPGTQLTNVKKVGNKTWYYIDIDASTANIILSFGSDATKTGDIYVNGNRYFEFANNNANNVTDYYDMPNGVQYETTPFTYVVNTRNWGDVYAYAWGNGYSGAASSWPGTKMTKVGTNGNGNDVYKWMSDSQTSPANVIFHNNSGEQSPDKTWANGALWSNYAYDYQMTLAGAVLNSTDFPDANLRKAITASTGIAEGGVITTDNIKVLDISYDTSKGMTGKITNPTGIEKFTALEELYSHDNSLSHLDLTHTSTLRVLDVSGDDALKGMRGVSYCSATGHGVNVKGNNHFKKLVADDCSAWVYNAGLGTNNSNYQYITSLEYISMKNCPLDGWSTGFDYQTGLKYLDISNTGQKTTNGTPSVDVTHLTQLETLIVANNYKSGAHLGSVAGLAGLNNLKYFDMSNCDGNPHAIVATFTNTQKGVLEYLDISNQHMTTTGADPALDGFTALKTFKFNTQATWTKALSINNCPALTYIDVSGNVAMTGLTINNCGITSLNFPEASTLSTLTSLATLDVSNNPFGVLTIPPTPNSLLTVTANDCNTMTRVLAEHNASKLQYVTAQNCPALTDITLNGVDIYFNKQLAAFDATNKSTLVTLDLSNDAMSTNYALDGFTALQTVDFDNNYMATNKNNLHEFSAINCPALTTVNLNGNANMKTVELSSNSFSDSSYPALTLDNDASGVTLKLNSNSFTSIPNMGGDAVTILYMNNNLLTDIDAPSNVKYLYAQNNNFPAGDYTLPQTSLVGLDLGNNGFTKFTATNNESLKSLALAGNTGLTKIELHNNASLTQTSPDGVIESDNGLYIKHLGNLQTLNIENSNFNKLGQQRSLQGVTALDTLQARNNHFTTFTNGVDTLNYWNTNSQNLRIPDPNESTLEDLTGLKYLDLAYNELRDSVHLYRNVNLRHLDVSHNRTIHGVYDGTIDVNNNAQVQAMIEKKGYHFMKYGNVYQVQATNPTANDWTNGYTNFQALRSRPFDLRIEDLNDTIGLYHLDLGANVNLEYLDFSYTNIHNTAAGPQYMNPGWIDRDWVTDLGVWQARSASNTISERVYATWHTFVYFIPCSKLKVIHADHNNMCSMGIRYFPELDTLTCSYMYGDCAMMRDFNTTGTSAITDAQLKYGMGNTGLSTQVQRLKSITWSTDETTGDPKAILTFEGPDPSTTYFPNPLKYWDISYSGFNEIRFYPGNIYTEHPNLTYVDVSGNPLNFTAHAANANYANTSNWNSLDVTYCPNIVTVKADNCSDLPIVRAHNLDALTSIDLTNDPNLKTVYVQNDDALPSITGLSTLTGLETLFVYNNELFGGIDVSNNTALKNLWASNIGASAIDVSNNTDLEKLRVYDNSITALNVGSNPALTWLDFARNQVEDIDLSANTALQYFNCSNSEETLNDPSATAGNHNGAEGDNVKPASGTTKASNGGNNLSDLVFPGTAIADVRANYNDLHCIKPGTNGSFANLTNIEFAHNHINGIDLSAASNVTIDSEDNGRAIVADCAKFTPQGDFGNVVTVYFFQLENVQGNGTQLTQKTSEDSKGTTRVLGTDGLVLDNINWNQGNAGMLRNVTVDPSNMSQYLDPSQVPGTIVVLEAENETANGADGRATYTYNNGAGNSTFYLDWSSDGTVTGINNVIGDNGFDLAGTYGGIVVTGKDGTVVGVYDLNGRQIASETIVNGTVTIDGLAPGVYIVNGNKVLVK